jgi:hypothetical protein
VKHLDDNKEIKKRFFTDLETGKKYMEPIHQLMDKYYEMYRNRWFDEDTTFQISDLYGYVETVVPILTNNRTRGTVKAEYPDYIKHAEGMGYILDHTYDTNNWDYKAQKVARMAEIYRSALAYTGYDPEANNGTGKLTITEINPRWCYLDPAVTELEDSGFFIYAEPTRISKVKKMYPKKADKIGEKKDNGIFTSDNKSNWFKTWIKSVANSITFFAGNNQHRYESGTILPELDEQEKRKNAVAFIHYWYRDDNDKWRVAYFADDLFLEDLENPFWHERLPFDIYSPTEDILSSLGIPMAEHIENLNWEKNVLLNTIINHAKKVVNPPRMYNTTMGIKDPRALKDGGEDNLIPIANPDFVPLNAIMADLHPAQMPNFVSDLPDRFDMIADRLTGVNDSFRGMSQATSGKEVQLKQEASYTRIKTKVDNFEKFVKSMSEKIIVNAMQFLNTSSSYRVKGDYSKYQDMNQDETPFEVEPIQQGIDETGQPIYDKHEFFLYANPNEWTAIEGEEAEEGKEGTQNAYRILQMTVEIEAGSSLPTSPMARKEEALELFSAGAIDQTALLDAYEYPSRDEIIKRMQEQQQQMVQQEVANQMGGQMPTEQQMPMDMMQQPQDEVGMSLEKIRAAVPELEGMSDEEVLQVLASMNQQQAPM